MRLAPHILVLLALAGCASDSEPDPRFSECPAEPSLRVAPLLDAAESHCSVEACTSGDEAYCRFFLPFDALVTAQLAVEPQACLNALTEQIACLERTACAGGCETERAAAEAPCELSRNPSVPEPFEGARTGCVHRADCSISTDDPEYDLEVAECLAEQGARLWVGDHADEPSCACELQELLGCLGSADLSCDAGREEEDAACPDQSAALSRCADGWSCVELGGSGGPSSCEQDVSCGGTVYTVGCEAGACSCTVDGEPGPALTATDCDRAAFQECGAPD